MLHRFRVADVARPILGADFFRRHGLLIDVKNRQLLRGDLPTVAQVLDTTSSAYTDLLALFPSITSPRFDPGHVPAHGVRHVVPTVGPPVFARARPLYTDKLSVAKKEFDKMMDMGIVPFQFTLGISASYGA